MSKTILIGCRLPNGIEIEAVDASGKMQKVTLLGQNSAQARSPVIILSPDDYGLTEVDEAFWAAWKKDFAEFPPLLNGAIFEAKDEKEAKAKHKELKGEKTGLEGVSQTDKNIEQA
ncbi:MAG: hypothetical protein J6D44_13645 [Pseudomonas sp.]|nr:hypothetical protein [Pseudomonas sp.]